MFTLQFNKEEFDKVVWQINSDFTKADYQQWLKSATQTLKEIYDDYQGEHDIYILGDIINILDNTQIKLNKTK